MLEALGSLPGECELRDQLRRAAASIVLNLAEGASRQSLADKRRFYLIARGSLGEVGAALDILRIRRRLSPARHAELHQALIEIARIDVWTGANCTSQDCSSYFNYGDTPAPVYFWELK